VRGAVQIDEHDNFDMFLPDEQSGGLSRQIDKSISEYSTLARHGHSPSTGKMLKMLTN
jgi:hypothetical protein